jgi:hypothetical protein
MMGKMKIRDVTNQDFRETCDTQGVEKKLRTIKK